MCFSSTSNNDRRAQQCPPRIQQTRLTLGVSTETQREGVLAVYLLTESCRPLSFCGGYFIRWSRDCNSWKKPYIAVDAVTYVVIMMLRDVLRDTHVPRTGGAFTAAVLTFLNSVVEACGAKAGTLLPDMTGK